MRAIWLGSVLIACILALGLIQVGFADDLTATTKKALQTAAFHTGELAQKGEAVTGTQLHLQHTINCLEGPSGMHFRVAAGYPCQGLGMGGGIIADLKALDAQGVKGAHEALKEASIAWDLALQAIAMKDVNAAQPWALVVSRHLKAAREALGG